MFPSIEYITLFVIASFLQSASAFITPVNLSIQTQMPLSSKILENHKLTHHNMVQKRPREQPKAEIQKIILERKNFLSHIVVTGTAFLADTSSASAISAQDAESSYNNYASTYDNLDGGKAADILGISSAREALISKARGKVLEIGVGTGLNIPFYAKNIENKEITEITFIDISDGMLEQAEIKASVSLKSEDLKINFIKADATSSELSDLFLQSSFDTVIDTFSLCVMGNLGAINCLGQMKNLVKPESEGGQILLLENSRSTSNAFLGWYQDITAETASKNGGKGCLYNQNVSQLIRDVPGGGLIIKEETEFAAGVFRSFKCVK